MPNNQLLPFAHDDNANVTPISQWESATNLRAMGFQSGIAKSDEVNRAIAQGANVGYAIGELIKDYAEADATIKPTTLYSNLKIALERFFRRQVIGFIYPIGSIYISTVATNPASLFGVGTWQRIGEGRGLIDAGNSIALGSTGGSATHTITTNEMPAHSHSGSTNTTGAHTHARGSMNITGQFGNCEEAASTFSGAFTPISTRPGAANDGIAGYNVNFDASRSWTGETSSNGNHSHTVSVGNTGGGQAMDIRNPYFSVCIWKRVA